MNVIETQGLSKSYKGVQALNNLTLSVKPHSIFGFLGPNGAGKSTTMKLLLGLAKPTEGSATVFGKDIRRESLAIRKRVGYLAQEPHFYDYLSARETLQFVARFFYADRAQVDWRVNETLELVGLSGKADRPIKGFSGGERQRLGLAQAQVNEPDLLILDEPAASLDPMGRRDVLAVMARLKRHATVFYSTHILDDVQRVSDEVAILSHGELVAQAPIETLLNGSEGVVYSLSAKGDLSEVRTELLRQPWVTALTGTVHDGLTTWQVSVSDENAAEHGLLRLALNDPDVSVTDYRRKTYELEDVFIHLIEEDNHDRSNAP